MTIRMIYGNEVLTLPAASVRAALASASAAELRVLVALAADPAHAADAVTDPAALAARAGGRIGAAEVTRALDFWRGAGVIEIADENEENTAAPDKARVAPGPVRDEIPQYTGEEVERLVKENGGLRSLIDECQRIAGKIFTPLEVNKVVALSDYLRLENEHILMLFGYCKSQGKPSVHYIEKTAFSLYAEGVDSLPALEAYIRRKEERASAEGKVRSLIGAHDRALTAREKTFIRTWFEDWQMPFDVIERAYEVTVNNTDKFNWPYMNKVLENWHAKGLQTAEAVDAAAEAYQKQKGQSGGSFDTDEFFDLALRRSAAAIGRGKTGTKAGEESK